MLPVKMRKLVVFFQMSSCGPIDWV